MKNPLKMTAPVGEILSPKGLLVRAAVLAVVFVILHLVGLRDFAGFLCGTLEAEEGMRELSALLGFVYVIMYLAFVVVAPILVIAAGLLFAAEKKPTSRVSP